MRYGSELRRIMTVSVTSLFGAIACSGTDKAADSGLSGATTASREPAGSGGQTSAPSAVTSGGSAFAMTTNDGIGGTVAMSRVTTGGQGGVAASSGSTTTKIGAGGTSNPTPVATGGSSATGGATASGGATSMLCPGASQVITVAADGSGQHKTVQAAINAVPSSNTKLVQISVKAGTYNEHVEITKPFVCLTGAIAESTIISATAGTNIVTGGTVIVTGNDFSAANITFRNSAPNGSAQAVALMANGKRQQFLNCRFESYQDTLYVNTGTQYFKNCYIQGDTDYIFGDATAVFEGCTMNNIAEGTAVTAPRTPQGTTYGFVFLGGALTANPTTSAVRSNHVYLGRPWGPYAAAAFINVTMGAHIAADGWTTMSANTLANTRFVEYGSKGEGANPTNATRATRQLTSAQAAQYTVTEVLSPWVPGYSQ